MTQAMTKQNMNIRKRRIMEALREVESEAHTICLESAATIKDEPTTSDGLMKQLISKNREEKTSSHKLKISTDEDHILDELMNKLFSTDDEDDLRNEQISTEEPTQYNVQILTGETTQHEVHNVEISTEEPTHYEVHNVEISTEEPTQYEVYNVQISAEEPTPHEVKNEPISGEPTPDVLNNEPSSTDQPTPAVVKNEPTSADEQKLDDLKKEQILKDKEEQRILREEQSKLIDVKLTILENWERSKREGMERLVVVVEKLQELEDEVDKLEDLLWSHNIEVDEEDYEMCYNNYVSENPIVGPLEKNAKSLRPQTPKREEQQTKRIKISATSTPISRKPKNSNTADKFEANEDGMVVIGPNGTMISKSALQAINWNLSGAALTRKILMEVFGRETLAFHTLTGKPSPAFMDCDKPMKNQLDPLKVADIIHLVMEHTQLTAKEVRNAITTKCADENKMYRQREKKRQNAALKLKKQKDN